MSHKVHPEIFRIGSLTNWKSQWFNLKNTPKYLEEDFYIRKFLKEKYKNEGLEGVEIKRYVNKIEIIISSSRPGLLIGRKGKGIEELQKEIKRGLKRVRDKSAYYLQSLKQKLLNKKKQKKAKHISISQGKDIKENLKIEIKEIRNPWIYSNLVGQWIASQIEKRLPYRKVIKQGLEKTKANKEVKGVKIKVAGRLNGVEIARIDWLKKGYLPLQTIRAKIDYSQNEAYCSYGVIGIKVWIYKGSDI